MSTSTFALLHPSHVFQLVYNFILEELQSNSTRLFIDTVLIGFILWVLLSRRYKISSKPEKLTPKEIDELCDSWKPEPLVPENPDDVPELPSSPLVYSSAAKEMVVDNKLVKNFGTYDFLGFVGDKDITNACRKTIEKYGVGSCGPRGFYGTIDVHLELENRIARFLGTETSILYSYGFCTISSAIPAFSKRGDLIICDDGVNFAVQTGVALSRSTVIYFKHNDMQDLERVLKEMKMKDGNKKVKQRRFLVIQGLYENFGDIAPLKKIVQLKSEYCLRLIMDDTYGVGVLGKTGRGTAEYCDVPISEIDILAVNLEASFGSIGGIVTGSNDIVEHQRLSGFGYTFSASQPPYLATAAIEAINRLDGEPEMMTQLSENIKLMTKELKNGMSPKVQITSHFLSPIFHIRATPEFEKQHGKAKIDQLFKRIQEKALEKGIAIVKPIYCREERNPPPPSLRITVCAKHTEEDIKKAAQVIKDCIQNVLESTK